LGSLKKKTLLGGRKVPRRKISNKKLSHNLKTRKAPLRVLPMTTFHFRHQKKQSTTLCVQKQNMEERIQTPLPPPPVQCSVENVNHQVNRKVKKSWRLKPITIRPMKGLHSSVSTLRWILLVIFIYLAAGTAIVIFQDGTESLKNIVVYSIIGFFTFFMGYLGWILARDVLEVFSNKKIMQNDANIEA
jgi:hypothetical protein